MGTKGEKAGSGRGRLLPVAFLGGIALLGGCLPQSSSDSDGGNDGKQPLMSFAGSTSNFASRSDKADPILDKVAAATRNLLEPDASTIIRRESSQPAGPTATSASVAPHLAAGPAAAAPLPDIADIPANIALAGFFRALGALESGRNDSAVTILHLGDSHIAADRFSGDMRDQFQSRFGNAGRGMVMPGLYISRGVKFDQAGKWQAAFSTGTAPGPYGISGVKVTAKAREDWLRLTTTDRPFGWAEVTLQTGPGQGSAVVGLDGDSKLVPLAATSTGWKTVRFEKQAREITIRPKGDGPITVHAIATADEKPGIRYVNLGLPGATAMTPLAWSSQQIAHDLKQVAPSLIIVGYGTEESFDDELDMRGYEAKVMAMLETLRQAAPQAALLVIGPPDAARLPKFAGISRSSDACRALSPQERASYAQRIGGSDQRLARWHPPLRLEEVRHTLRRAAAANRAFFWDWSKLMGGTCGVHAWVHSDPPLAANDHVHLTEEGSKRSARLLFRELMNGYDSYDRAVAVGAGGWKPAVSQAEPAPTPAAIAPRAAAAATRKPK